ncbi:MAG: hypothetical protein K6E84_05545, partial [Lachnospiraceae bacterium]|nr:hypothetical protein [Lachnospiraceae bacterium]
MRKNGKALLFTTLCVLWVLVFSTAVFAGDPNFKSPSSFPLNQTMNNFGEATYQIDLPSDGVIKLKAETPMQGHTSSIWRIRLYDKNYKELEFTFDVYGNQSVAESSQVGLAAGRYYCFVGEGTRKSDSALSLTVSYTASDLWEKEMNNDFTTATALPVNTRFSGCSTNVHDQDIFAVNLPQDGMLQVTFDHVKKEKDTHYWEIRFFDPQYKDMGYEKVYGNTDSMKTTQLGLPKGQYFIQVIYCYNFDDSTYHITAGFTPSAYWEKEHNDSFTTATDMEVGKEYFGSIFCERSNDDYYKINVTKGDDYNIILRSAETEAAKKSWNAALIGNDYKDIKEFVAMADGKQYSMTEYLSPGSYFIRVRADGYFTQKTYGLTVISKSAQSAGSGSDVTGPAKCRIRSAKNSAKKT